MGDDLSRDPFESTKLVGRTSGPNLPVVSPQTLFSQWKNAFARVQTRSQFTHVNEFLSVDIVSLTFSNTPAPPISHFQPFNLTVHNVIPSFAITLRRRIPLISPPRMEMSLSLWRSTFDI